MSAQNARESGKTLGRIKGRADLRRVLPWHTLRQTTLTLAAIAAFVAGVAGVGAALEGFADAGVVVDGARGTILSVSPAGFAWRDGVRAGQHVVALETAVDSGGWRLETSDGGQIWLSAEAHADQGLRDSLGLGVLGMFAGALAVLFRNTHRQLVAPAAAVGFLASGTPLLLSGSSELSTSCLAAAVLAPTIWLAGGINTNRWAKLAAVAGAGAIIAAWALARASGSSLFDGLEGLRGQIATIATVLLFGNRIVLPVLSRDPIHLMRPRLADAVVVAAIGGGALALVYYFSISPIVVGVLIVVVLVALPGLRKWTRSRLEVALFQDLREQAGIEAAEVERARMARELHDVPLQHLAGIIRRLELRPDAQAESDELRVIASQLRTVATDLRPPVLDDLGLGPALEFLAEEAANEGASILADVADRTGIEESRRPDSPVELAIFRIAQEAVSNALHHAGPCSIRIEGTIDPDRIDVAIIDSGPGIAANAMLVAGRQGRLGLASMRRRAQAIDADLSIDGSGEGTTIRVAWRR
jgi:signal transduction histidine kinase